MFVLQIDDKVSIHAKREVVADVILQCATCDRNPLADGHEFTHVPCAIAYLAEQGVRVRVSECAGWIPTGWCTHADAMKQKRVCCGCVQEGCND